jgi:Domain of unknown function (DUF1844)
VCASEEPVRGQAQGPNETPVPPSGEPTHAEARETGPEETSPPGSAPQVVPLGALAARDLLIWFLSLLAAKAWEGMGLVPNPATNKIGKDLADARIAIDAYGAIFDVVRAQLDEQPRREMETLLTTLRLNFVEKSTA